MSSGQMNFNMRFTADTSQAQSSIQKLQTSLSQIAMVGAGTGISKGMSEAASAAKELSYHLNQAYNATTGNFDLSRLDKSLKTSKTNVSELSSKLLQAGQTGQQAFVQLAQSIAAADRPMVTLSSRMSDLFTSIKNTAKWQISSSVIHGFMGAVQSAYGYAQDLNESLNNIRIVTGYNTDQMAAFAEKANKAAKALSTTTTAYTDAALIYYQQGLGDKEIEERTDVTVKMANVSRQSAETVSDQMTAIWNNFYDGSKSLEYYADVMTKLGAETASSSDEIAQGLEKFAAVSESVGLSYEYATAALATVTAETRQSADVVGTAFKAMFARIQGLKLGKTLEDGTDLNQYSKALSAVGVNIKDANGELKDMDAILREMAAVWETLNRDEQVALAQKVAGIRQYNQLMSLMNNWDVMEQNLEFVGMSEGTLQEQADIYAESWEAASNRVRASMESIYSDLIDDSFFIDLTNGFAKLLNSLDAFIDGFGGVKMIVISVASILMSTFAHKIPGALENLKANFNVVFKGASAQAQALAQDFNNVINAKLQDPNLNFNKSQEVALTNAKLLNEAKSKMLVIQDKMTGSEKQLADTELSIIGALEQETQVLADQIAKRQQEIALLKEEMSYENADDEVYKAYGDQESALAERYAAARQGSPLQEGDTVASTNKALQEQRALINQVADARKEYISILATGYEQEMAATNGQIEKSSQVLSLYDLMGDKINEYIQALKNMNHGTGAVEDQKAPFREIAKEISLITGDSCPKLTQAINEALDAKNAEEFKTAVENVAQELKNGQIEGKNFGKILKQFGQGTYVDKMNQSYKDLNQTTKDLTAKQDALNQKIKEFNPTHVVTGIEKITAVAGGLGQVAMLATSVRSIFQAWNNDDLSFGEKLTTTFMGLSMIVPAAIGAFKSFNGVLGITSAIQNVLTISTLKNMEAESASLAVMSAEEIAKTKSISLDTAKLVLAQAIISTTMAKIGAENGLNAAQAATTIATMTGMSAEQAKLIVDKVSNGMTIAQAMAEAGLTGARSSGVIATIAQTVAQWALNASMAPTLALTLGIAAALGTLLAGFAGLVAIIGLAVAGVKTLNDKLHEDSIAAKEAAEHADLMAEKYNKLAEEANKFKESVSNYDTAVESLKKLEKGTDEYKDAITKANEEAQKLIELYGLWDKVKGYDENGLIVFKDNALQEVQAEKDTAANNAKWEADAARIGSIYKDIQEVSGQVAKDVGLVIKDSKKLESQNATVPSFRQLNQSELGEIAGVFGQLDNIQQMSDDALKDFLENSNSLSSHLKDIIPNIIKNREAFENLSKVLNSSASELEFKTKELISGTIDKQFDSKIDDMSVNSNTGKIDEGRRAQILNAAATGLYQFEMNKEQGLAAQLSEIDVKGVSNTLELQKYEQYKDVTNDEELARKYAEVILGKSAVDNLQYVKGRGEGGLKDENGNTVLDTTDDKYMRRRLAQYAEEQNIKDSYEASDTEYRTQYMSALEDLVAGGDTLGAELGTDLTGALLESLQSGVGTLDLTSIFGGLNEGERDSLINLDENQLAEKLGMTPEKLKTLGFESAEAFETAFDNSLQNWTPELAKENFLDDLTSKTSEDAKAFGLDPEMLQEVAEGFADMAEAGEEGYDSLNENAELASDAATRYVRLQDAVLDLSDNYDDYADVLKGVRSASDEVDKGYAANSESGKKLKKSLAGLLGTTEDLIDADLLEAIDPGDFKAAAAGDEAAIGRIRDSFMQLQAEANGIDFTKLKEEIDGLDEGVSINLDTDSFLSDLITAKLNAGATADDIEHMLSGLGIDMDTIQFYDSLDAAVTAAETTGGIIVDALSFSQQTTTDATEIQKNNEENGFVEHFQQDTISEMNEVTETMEDGTIVSKQIPSILHSFTKTVTDNPIPTTSSETVTNTEQKTTNGAGKTGNVPPKKAAVVTGKKSVGGRVSPGTVNRARGGGGGGGKGGGGGGGSKPKPAKPTKKSDIVERYKEQDDQLDDLKRTMDNAEKSLEKLYGDDKAKAIEKLIQAEKDYKDVLKEKRSEAREALKEDRKALNAAASKVSVEFEYDAEGNLINYTEQMEALYSRLRAVEKAAGPEWTESEQEQIDALKEKIEALKEAQEQYESTRELIEDISDELKDLAGKPAMPLIKSDYIDIYKEIIDALDDIDKRLERLAKRADDLMGSKRLKQFKQFEGTSEEKLALIDEELSKNKTDIRQNKTYLKRVSKVLDVDAPKYDKKGNIVNSDEVLNVLWKRVLKAQERAKKDDGKISKAEQEIIDARLAEIDMYTSARDKYSDAVEYRKDLNAEKKEITDKVTVLPVVTNDFLDIYKEADDILDDIEHKASKIADESERATGKDKVAKLKELAKTEKERYQYIKKAQEINTSDKTEKKAAMEKAASSLKIPIKFAYDDNGNITNYNEIKQQYEQKYAAAYAEAMKDGFINADERDWLEQFKSDGETIEEYIQKYAEAVEQGEDLEEQAREAEQAAEDYILEALSYTVELNIEADERDLKLIEYQLSQLEDQGYATAEAMDLIDKKYTSLMNQSTSYTKGIDSIFKKYIDEGKLTQKAVDAFWNGDASGINWSIFSEAEIDKINEYSDGIMTVSESLMELRKTMDEAVISAFEEWTADMKEQLSLFDHYKSIINSYNNITDLVGQERLGISDEDRKKYNDLRIDNATNRLASSKTYFDETKEKITKAEIEKAAAEARLTAAQSSGDESLIKAAEKDVKMWEDTLKVMYQENRDAEQQYLADWEAALQASRDAFLAETEMELEAFEKKMAGVYGSFDNMQKEFNRQSEKNDRYLQDYEKLYQLSKLNRDLSNKIDDTTNLKAKKELAKLQEEILEYQKDGVKMSDYDLKFLQKRYDLKLAEIALEEAQNAKTQVRLTRDSEGNYSYTYTADEDSIAKAQQSYEDKLYEISNLSNEYIEQQTSKLLSTQQAFVNELAEIHKKAAEGQYATTEEYQQALDDCSAYYTEQLAYYGDEIDKAASNNSTVYENDYLNYEGWMLEKIRKTEEDADAYIAGASNKSAAEAGFITSVRDLLPELEQAHIDATGYVSAMTTEIGSAEEGTGLLGASRQSYEDYGLKIDDVMVAAGSSTETFKDKMSEYLLTGEDSVANSSDEARQKIEEMALAVTDLDKTIANVSAWQTSYSGEIQKAIDKTAEFIGQINDMNQSLADKAEEEAQKPTPKPDPVTPTLENPVANPPKKNPPKKDPPKKDPPKKNPPKKDPPKKDPPKKNPPKSKQGNGKLNVGDKVTLKEGKYYYASSYGEYRKGNLYSGKKKGVIIDQILSNPNNGQVYYIHIKGADGVYTDLGWVKKSAIEGYDTGGYTGSWGAEGKLAMLHEKELVLNKEDTENMLKMVSMVRDIVSVLDIKAYQASLAQLAANQLSPMTNSQNAFEQTVTIHAEFPDAIYANEIETALNNLVNSASQFANRKY